MRRSTFPRRTGPTCHEGYRERTPDDSTVMAGQTREDDEHSEWVKGKSVLSVYGSIHST